MHQPFFGTDRSFRKSIFCCELSINLLFILHYIHQSIHPPFIFNKLWTARSGPSLFWPSKVYISIFNNVNINNIVRWRHQLKKVDSNDLFPRRPQTIVLSFDPSIRSSTPQKKDSDLIQRCRGLNPQPSSSELIQACINPQDHGALAKCQGLNFLK